MKVVACIVIFICCHIDCPTAWKFPIKFPSIEPSISVRSVPKFNVPIEFPSSAAIGEAFLNYKFPKNYARQAFEISNRDVLAAAEESYFKQKSVPVDTATRTDLSVKAPPDSSPLAKAREAYLSDKTAPLEAARQAYLDSKPKVETGHDTSIQEQVQPEASDAKSAPGMTPEPESKYRLNPFWIFLAIFLILCYSVYTLKTKVFKSRRRDERDEVAQETGCEANPTLHTYATPDRTHDITNSNSSSNPNNTSNLETNQ